MYLESPPIVDPAFVAAGKNDALTREYHRAVLEHPLPWARVKAQAFGELIRPTVTRYWFHTGINPNEFGLVQNRRLDAVRDIFTFMAGGIVASSGLRWFSGVHLVWLVVAAVGFAVLGGCYLKIRQPNFGLWAALLTIPLAYYGSYLLAVPARDFRFMYPSTLLIQVIFVAFVLSAGISLLSSKRRTDQRQQRAGSQIEPHGGYRSAR